jgi:Fe2+ transport system protein FeoA
MDLGMCQEGDCVTVVRVRGNGMIRKRLLEMGVLKGTQIKIVKYAPLRDPMEIIVGGAHLSLRVSEAATIDVQKCAMQGMA